MCWFLLCSKVSQLYAYIASFLDLFPTEVTTEHWVGFPKLYRKSSAYLYLDLSTELQFHTFNYRRKQWHPTPAFLPGKSHGWRSLVGCHLWGRTVRHDWSDLAAAAAAYSTISFTFFTKSTGNLKLSTTEANFWSSHTKTLISYLNKGLLCSSYSEQILRPIGLPILIPDPWLNGLSSFYL